MYLEKAFHTARLFRISISKQTWNSRSNTTPFLAVQYLGSKLAAYAHIFDASRKHPGARLNVTINHLTSQFYSAWSTMYASYGIVLCTVDACAGPRLLHDTYWTSKDSIGSKIINNYNTLCSEGKQGIHLRRANVPSGGLVDWPSRRENGACTQHSGSKSVEKVIKKKVHEGA